MKIGSTSIARWYSHADRLGFEAVNAFEVLGTNGVPAVPELTQIVKSGPRRGLSQSFAMDALSSIGKDGFPPLLQALEDKRIKRQVASRILSMYRRDVDIGPAIPAFLLIDRETERFPQVSNVDYFYAMSELYDYPEFLVPELMNCLKHTNSEVRLEAAKALGRLGSKALPAVPALKEALDVRVIAVQEAAINALEKIAPEVLTNGVKDF